ncbi:MAG: GNAT family N-acetyltransferase [Flavobacterium sp.]|nr:GNAT family N-acetyltransferase [Flavobacterium sp.]
MNYFNQETARLQLRRLTLDDIPTWTEFFVNNDRLKYLGIDLTKDHETLATEWILSQLKRYENQGLGFLAAIEKKSGNFIGLGGILPRDINNEVLYEIAYSLKPEFWGKGYATEIAKQMSVFCFESKLAAKTISIIHKENSDSIKVAQKNGMKILYDIEDYLGMNVHVFGTE